MENTSEFGQWIQWETGFIHGHIFVNSTWSQRTIKISLFQLKMKISWPKLVSSNMRFKFNLIIMLIIPLPNKMRSFILWRRDPFINQKFLKWCLKGITLIHLILSLTPIILSELTNQQITIDGRKKKTKSKKNIPTQKII